MKQLTIAMIALILFLICPFCNDRNTTELFPNAILFSMDDVELIHADNLRHIELFPLIQPTTLRVYDTILIIYGKSTVNDKIIHLYNVKNGHHINSFATQGRGPDEFSGGFGEFKLLTGRRELYLYDMNYKKAVVYHLDSLGQDDLAPFQSTTFAEYDFLLHLRLNDSDYVFNPAHYGVLTGGNTMMLGRYSAVKGEITKRIAFPVIEGFDSVLNQAHQRAIFPIAHAGIDYNDESEMIVISHYNTDVINVYDSDLILRYRLHGPDQFLPVFEFSALSVSGGVGVATGPTYPEAKSVMDKVVFTEGKARYGYYLVEAHKNGFYVGYDGGFRPEGTGFRRIFHFANDGTPLRCFAFDRDLWGGRFTVDEKRGIIYIIARDLELYAFDIPD